MGCYFVNLASNVSTVHVCCFSDLDLTTVILLSDSIWKLGWFVSEFLRHVWWLVVFYFQEFVKQKRTVGSPNSNQCIACLPTLSLAWIKCRWICTDHTVDGRNPAPVEVGSCFSHYLQGFKSTIQTVGFPSPEFWTNHQHYIFFSNGKNNFLLHTKTLYLNNGQFCFQVVRKNFMESYRQGKVMVVAVWVLEAFHPVN